MPAISRRRFVRVGVTAYLSSLATDVSALQGRRATPAAADQPISATIEQWMAAWMEDAARQPVGALHVMRFVEPIYVLLKPIVWKPNRGQERYAEVAVPAGFVTDFASIPRGFFSALRPDGEYTYPAIVHDYLYWTQTRSRADSDMIFKLGMQDFGINAATVGSIHTAVRAGGGSSWRKNAELKRRGERRILKTLPDDPRTRWSEWKLKPDVFQ